MLYTMLIRLFQLVVVGDQSSGKSSVLEGLTELPFSRDSTLCTRFATQIVFRRAEQESVTVYIIPSPSSDAAREAKLKTFKDDSLNKGLQGTTFRKSSEEVGTME
jgi:GTPase SAR1 family protein